MRDCVTPGHVDIHVIVTDRRLSVTITWILHFSLFILCYFSFAFFHRAALVKLMRTISWCAGPASHSSKNKRVISIFCTSHLDVQKSRSDIFSLFIGICFSLGCPTKVGFELMQTISWCAGPASHSPKNKPRPQGLLFARDVWISTILIQHGPTFASSQYIRESVLIFALLSITMLFQFGFVGRMGAG